MDLQRPVGAQFIVRPDPVGRVEEVAHLGDKGHAVFGLLVVGVLVLHRLEGAFHDAVWRDTRSS